MEILLVAIFIAGLVVLWKRRRPRREDTRLESLRREYFQLASGTRAEARERLARHLEGMMERNPGKSLEWCLERVILELRRDQLLN